MNRKVIVLLFLSSLITGCATELDVPKDFQLEYRRSPIGVTPSNETFIVIDPLNSDTGTAQFRAGTDKKFLEETPQRTVTSVDRQGELSADECLGLYRLLMADKFFELENAYSPSETVTGGASRSLRVTANGSTKQVVLAANASVGAFERIAKKVHTLAGLQWR